MSSRVASITRVGCCERVGIDDPFVEKGELGPEYTQRQPTRVPARGTPTILRPGVGLRIW